MREAGLVATLNTDDPAMNDLDLGKAPPVNKWEFANDGSNDIGLPAAGQALGAAVDVFCAAKAAEGSSPRTVEWYRMILIRAARRFGAERPVDAVPAADLRAWLLELWSSLAPESIAGYVRGLKAFGNWCAAEELAAAAAHRPVLRSGATEPRRPGRRA